MTIFKKTKDLQFFLTQFVDSSGGIGFVPTMGALHNGHISLLAASKKSNALSVCSIFVNPVQFNDPKDYEKYPVTIEKDIRLLEEAGCDVLFLPAVSELYPTGEGPHPHYSLGELERELEGRYRPGHFQGVCVVMDKLLTIVAPDNLYLGQKDYQQCMVINKLLSQMQTDKPIHVRICSTIREPGGLAMSSRNMRLNAAEKEQASAIYRTLEFVKSRLQPGSLEILKSEAIGQLEQAGLRPDYFELADGSSLKIKSDWDGQTKIVALVAAFMNDVRLIDNMVLN